MEANIRFLVSCVSGSIWVTWGIPWWSGEEGKLGRVSPQGCLCTVSPDLPTELPDPQWHLNPGKCKQLGVWVRPHHWVGKGMARAALNKESCFLLINSWSVIKGYCTWENTLFLCEIWIKFSDYRDKVISTCLCVMCAEKGKHGTWCLNVSGLPLHPGYLNQHVPAFPFARMQFWHTWWTSSA